MDDMADMPADMPADAMDDMAAAAAGGFGVPECDDFIKMYKCVIEKTPEAGKAAAQQGLEAMEKGWKQVAAGGEAAKAALKTACETASKGVKEGWKAVPAYADCLK
jgi:hypothetical protein